MGIGTRSATGSAALRIGATARIGFKVMQGLETNPCALICYTGDKEVPQKSRKTMNWKRFRRPFRQLRGKLTLSYTLTSVVTFLVLELLLISIILTVVSFNIPAIAVGSLKSEATQISPYFVHGNPDPEELNAALKIIYPSVSNQGPFSGHPEFLAVVDLESKVLTSIGTHPLDSNTSIQDLLSPQSSANLQAVLSDSKGTTSKFYSETDGTVVGIAPIVGQNNRLVGALVIKTQQPNPFVLVGGSLQFVLLTVTVVTIIAAIAGSVFGYVAARGITRRLKRLSDAADRWGYGDFTAQAHDSSEDEIGQMARQLNRMAEQLQQLLEARQALATLEERNRLARDLHDSVKQQIFAVSMQIGATKVLLKCDTEAAEKRLDEAEKLVHQAQQELTSLIRELRPVPLEGKGLVAALRELATEWSQQTNIVANVRVEGIKGHSQASGHAQGSTGQPRAGDPQSPGHAPATPGHPQGASLLYTEGVESQDRLRIQVLPLNVEEALFRVAQEALSNVARHSQATLVQMVLSITEEKITLMIVDNGRGFDAVRQGRPGVGLLSMQERMRALGGDVQVESTPGKGTQVIAYCNRLGIDRTVVGDEGEAGEVPTQIQG